MKKILIIEDDKRIRRYLEIELTKADYEVTLAEDGESGLNFCKENNYDLILLDLMLPKISGEILCKELRKFLTTPIIIISATDLTFTKVSLLDLGANDYVTKPFNLEELLARIRVAIRGSSNKNSNTLLYGDFKIDNDLTTIFYKNEPLNLSKKEYYLLEYFIINREIILTREQIISNVWGYDYSGDEQIVDAFVKMLRKKFDENYIKTVRGFGYQFKKD